MDNFRINRLDFTKMVDKHIYEHPEAKYVNATKMNPQHYYSRNGQAHHVNEIHDNKNIQSKIDGIVAHVYSQLREQKHSELLKTKAMKEPSTPDKSSTSHIGKRANFVLSNLGGSKKTQVVIDNPANSRISIPRLKVLCNQKEQKCLHHSVPPLKNTNNYVNQKRLVAIKQKNAAFKSMLEDQKNLQRDRQSIAQEVVTMRNRLDVMRGRLDNSLKKLELNKTYGELNSASMTKIKRAIKCQ